ncbi:MAG: SDR family oxidoreductase [Proteobacteria bacterium]|nr:SDR family oxidoreductase [Pseudomonadota bacterium]
MDRDSLLRLFDLSGRVAIVTGGSRGIGRSIAGGFAAAGATVVIASRKADACEAAAREIEAEGGQALPVACHMGRIEDTERLVETTARECGGIDIVVNNAANALALYLGQVTPDAWQKSLDANLRGPVFLVQQALPHLVESGHASVINVLSGAAYLFASFQMMYAAGKAGLLATTRSMAAQLADRGVRVNALVPGTIDTDMVRNNPPEVQEAMAKSSLMGRAAHPDELIGAALLLASDAGSFITGHSLFVDGGQTPH